MNGKDLLTMVEVISNEKKLNKEVVFKALERALSVAARKDFGKLDLSAAIDRKTGDYIINKNITVVDDNEENFDPLIHLYEDQAEDKYGRPFEIGEKITEFLSSEALSRVAAQVFKQSIKENIRRAQKEEWQQEYYDKKGHIITASVKKFVSGDVVVSLNEEVEGILPQKELIGYERFSIGQRIMVVLKEVVDNYKGQQLIFSRANEDFILALMKKEIPDVGDENIEIVNIAREASHKTKVVVKSLVPHLDPVRECLGHKGNRIKIISSEANNEIIEIVEYQEDLVDFVISLMKPVDILSFYSDEKTGKIFVSVEEDSLFRARGKESINERLISSILKKDFSIVTEEELHNIENKSISNIVNMFMEEINVDEELAEILAMEGFDSIESIYYVPTEEMLDIEGFDESLVMVLKEAAKVSLEEEEQQSKKVFLKLGFSEEEVEALVDNDIKTVEDLAELSILDLLDYIEMEEDKAANIILEARKVWN